ncbi:hypothetical protein [Streptomyces sp. NPDC056723]|uniref:hypothetical protein n=1 Tax=Streptomyces sp. NPDC056723 TaxID=3345925 RepID=UPI0036D15FC2
MNARKRMAWLAATAALGSGFALAGPSAAHAGAAPVSVSPATVINHSCGPRTSPSKVSHPYDFVHTTIGKARIALRNGNRGNTEYYWARITGGAVGNTVWLDWADTESGQKIKSWHLCGPYKIHSGHDNYTLAVNYVYDGVRQRHFRACGHHAGVTRCTGWE